MRQKKGVDPRHLALAQAIHTLLERRGVSARRHRAVLEAALDMQYQQVRRRMTGETAWEVHEIASLAAHFDEPVFKLLAILFDEAGQDGVLHLQGVTAPCTVWLGEAVTDSKLRGPLVAVPSEPDGTWLVLPIAQVGDRPAHEIKRLAMEEAPRRRIAVVDADKAWAGAIVQFLRRKGLDAIQFASVAHALAGLDTSDFEGFILDWNLISGDPPALLPEVRAKSSGPILLLSGPEAPATEADDRLAIATAKYRAQLYEKPTSNFSLFNALELGFSAAPLVRQSKD